MTVSLAKIEFRHRTALAVVRTLLDEVQELERRMVRFDDQRESRQLPPFKSYLEQAHEELLDFVACRADRALRLFRERMARRDAAWRARIGVR